MSNTIFSYEAPFLSAALDHFKDYLLSNEIFWNLGLNSPQGHPPYPQLSLGNLLLSFTRLLALSEGGLLSDAQSVQFAEFDSALRSFRKDWQTAWAGKAEKEFGIRLRQWARFLDELGTSAQGQASSFKNGLRIRAAMQLLLSHFPKSEAALQPELALQDKRFKHLSSSGDFVWENELKEHFSPEEYWFLRSQPKK